MIRPARVLAVARRDLAIGTNGRRGLALPLLFGVLLLPIALLPVSNRGKGYTPPPMAADLIGDVPPEVAALPGVHVAGAPQAQFTRGSDGVLHVYGRYLPPSAREVLDRDDRSAVLTENVFPDMRIPQRTLLIALITASILAGSVAESLPGERSHRTLETMLTAGITRAELVIGKWATWAGIGALAVALSSVVALALGRVTPGFWMLPMPLVPACTVALGLFLVRRSADIVGGATISVRVLPALLGVSGIIAWLIGTQNPMLGAAVPLGGALLATGEAWDGVLPPLIATAVTGATTAGLLAATARDLESDPSGREAVAGRWRAAAIVGGLGGFGWWTCLIGPELWGLAGNPNMTRGLDGAEGITGAALMVLVVVATWGIAAYDSADSLLLRRVRATSLGPIVLVGFLAAVTTGASALVSPSVIPELADARLRTAAALCPDGLGLLVASVLAQELLFRGAILRLVGPIPAAIAAAVILSPLDPVRGLIIAGLFTALARMTGSSVAAIAAHLVWAALIAVGVGFSPLVSVGLGAVGIGVLWAFPSMLKD